MSVYTRRGKDKRMNKLKRILSIIISFIMIITAFSINAIAEEKDELTVAQKSASQKITLLSNIGIYDFEYEWDEVMYRIDFAQAMSRLINCPVNGYTAKDLYDDVSPDDKGYGEVSVMYDMDIMNGKGNRIFAPDDYITVPEAITAMVRLLGYTAKAQAKGGYPGGYTLTATDLGLLKNVSYEGCDEGITAGALAEIIYNALEVEMVDSYILDNSGIKVTGLGRRTILESYLGLKKGEGLVSAYDVISILTPLQDKLEYDEVKIDEETYRFECEEMASFLGYKAEYFYREKTGGEAYSTVVFAEKKTNASDVTVYDKDIDTADSQNIKTKKNSGGKTYKIASDATIIKNGVSVSKMKEEYIPKNGYIKMISNNGSTYDVVLIFDFQSFVTASSSNGKISFKYGLDLDGEKLIDLENTDKLVTVILDGEIVDPEDIKKEDVVSIAYDKNFGYYIVISRKNASGTITSTYTNPFRIGINERYELVNQVMMKAEGEIYDVNEEFLKLTESGTVLDLSPLEVGKESVYYIDFLGKICGMGDISSKQYYGYLYGAKTGGTLSEDYEVRIFSNHKRDWFDYKLAETCKLNGIKTDGEKIIASLKNYISEMDSKLHKNPTTLKIDDFRPSIVKFEVDKNDNIKNIVTNTIESNDPTQIGDNTLVLSKPYYFNVYQHGYDYFTNFADGASDDNKAKYGIKDKLSAPSCYGGDAVCMQIPQNRDETDSYKVGSLQSVMPRDYNTPRPFLYYDLDQYGLAGLCVYVPESGGENILINEKVYGVDSVSTGEECAVLYLVDSQGNNYRYETIDKTELVDKCKKLKKGDFIQISLDANNRLIAVAEYFSYDINKFNPNDYVAGGKFYQRMKDTSSPEGYGIGFMKAINTKNYESTSGASNSGAIIRFDSQAVPYTLMLTKNLVVFDGENYTAESYDSIVEGDYILFRMGSQNISDVYIFRNSGFTDESIYLVNKN